MRPQRIVRTRHCWVVLGPFELSLFQPDPTSSNSIQGERVQNGPNRHNMWRPSVEQCLMKLVYLVGCLRPVNFNNFLTFHINKDTHRHEINVSFLLTLMYFKTLLRACYPDRWGNMWQVTPPIMYKRDKIKMRYYMGRRVTSPTWGSPPPCKQALTPVSCRGWGVVGEGGLLPYMR